MYGRERLRGLREGPWEGSTRGQEWEYFLKTDSSKKSHVTSTFQAFGHEVPDIRDIMIKRSR